MTPTSWRKGPGEIESEVIMTRQLHSGSFLIVEGEDDHRFWRSRVAPRLCELVIGDGKPNVEGAIMRLDNRDFSGALGIVDDDFDALEGRALPSSNLLTTDAHDLECLLLRSAALTRVLAECGDPNKIRRFEDTHGCTVRDALLARGLGFGRLRWLALRRGWDLPFTELRPERFADRGTWEVDQEGVYAAVGMAAGQVSIDAIHAAIHAYPTQIPGRSAKVTT